MLKVKTEISWAEVASISLAMINKPDNGFMQNIVYMSTNSRDIDKVWAAMAVHLLDGYKGFMEVKSSRFVWTSDVSENAKFEATYGNMAWTLRLRVCDDYMTHFNEPDFLSIFGHAIKNNCKIEKIENPWGVYNCFVNNLRSCETASGREGLRIFARKVKLFDGIGTACRNV
jgi:hypothetical protein